MIGWASEEKPFQAGEQSLEILQAEVCQACLRKTEESNVAERCQRGLE